MCDEEVEEIAYQIGREVGIKSCAAYPWTYRTEEDDEVSQINKDAELPEADEERLYLFKVKHESSDRPYVFTGFWDGNGRWFINEIMRTEEAREKIIAFAEIWR